LVCRDQVRAALRPETADEAIEQVTSPAECARPAYEQEWLDPPTAAVRAAVFAIRPCHPAKDLPTILFVAGERGRVLCPSPTRFGKGYTMTDAEAGIYIPPLPPLGGSLRERISTTARHRLKKPVRFRR
jgi:hypothetical protein